jgi:hypothetical protein
VLYEIGHADALRKRVLPFLTHPSLEVPAFLKGIHYETDIDRVVLFFTGRSESSRSSTGAESRRSFKGAEGPPRAPAIRTRNWNDLEKTASRGIDSGRSKTEVTAILRSRGVSAHDAEKIVRDVSRE